MDEQRVWIKSRRKRRLRLLAAAMCVSVLVTSCPNILETLSVLAASERQETETGVCIYGFEELPEDIREQYVPMGTEREELLLPSELEALCGEIGSAAPEQGTEEEGTESGELPDGEETEEVSGNDTEESEGENPAETESGTETEELPEAGSTETIEVPEDGSTEAIEVPEEGSTEPAAEAGAVELPEYYALPEEQEIQVLDLEPASEEAEQRVFVSVTWEDSPEYDGDTEGVYLFTPVLPENYFLAEGVRLPEVKVTVAEKAIRESGIEIELTEPDWDDFLVEEYNSDVIQVDTTTPTVTVTGGTTGAASLTLNVKAAFGSSGKSSFTGRKSGGTETELNPAGDTYDITSYGTYYFTATSVAGKTRNQPIYVRRILFTSNGGTAVPTQLVVNNGKALQPAPPTRTGYTFGGWYSDSALTTAYAHAVLPSICLRRETMCMTVTGMQIVMYATMRGL